MNKTCITAQSGNNHLKRMNPLPCPKLISILVLVSALLAGCSAANPATPTTPGTTTPSPITTSSPSTQPMDTLVIEGLILTNGTVFVTKGADTLGLINDLLVVHLPDDKPIYSPGALVEFTIQSSIAESYPPQARAVSSRLLLEKSPVIKAPIAMAPKLKFHMPTDSILIDVRTPEEYKSGYIPEAVNIPLDNLKTGIASQVKDQSQTVMVYCHTGSRSATAAKLLKDMGYRVVLDLGGILDFKEDLVK